MAKPNKDCPKCCGTGWVKTPGTLRQHPCPDCTAPVEKWRETEPSSVYAEVDFGKATESDTASEE